MRRMMMLVVFALFFAGMTQNSKAQEYAAKITVNTGSSFVVKKINIRNDRLYSDNGKASTSVDSIKYIEFRYIGINLNLCKSMYRMGDRKSLESLLNQYVGPTTKYSYIPGNIGSYLEWLLRVQIWNRNYEDAKKTIATLRSMPNPDGVQRANLYFVFLLLEQEDVTSAKKVFDSITERNAASPAMLEYLTGRIAYERGDYDQAMQSVAKILAFHSRDIEWMPPTTLLEAKIYKAKGQSEKVIAVADELIMAYPGTEWCTFGEEIKKEVQP